MLGRSFVHSWLQSVATRENERRRHCHTAEKGEKCIFPLFRCCFFYIAAARLSFGVPCKNRCCTFRRRSQKTYPFASSLSLPTIATSETILIATNCFPDISLPPPLLFFPSFFSHWGLRPPPVRPLRANQRGGRALAATSKLTTRARSEIRQCPPILRQPALFSLAMSGESRPRPHRAKLEVEAFCHGTRSSSRQLLLLLLQNKQDSLLTFFAPLLPL